MEENVKNEAAIAEHKEVVASPRLKFGEAIGNCFKNYANFKGRARRSEYWNFYLFGVLAVVGSVVLSLILGNISPTLKIVGDLIEIVVALGLVLPQCAVGFRRLHDVGKSGWLLVGYWIFSLIPIGLLFVASISEANGKESPSGLGVAFAVTAFLAVAWQIALFVMTLLDSKPEANTWGASPKY